MRDAEFTLSAEHGGEKTIIEEGTVDLTDPEQRQVFSYHMSHRIADAFQRLHEALKAEFGDDYEGLPKDEWLDRLSNSSQQRFYELFGVELGDDYNALSKEEKIIRVDERCSHD